MIQNPRDTTRISVSMIQNPREPQGNPREPTLLGVSIMIIPMIQNLRETRNIQKRNLPKQPVKNTCTKFTLLINFTFMFNIKSFDIFILSREQYQSITMRIPLQCNLVLPRRDKNIPLPSAEACAPALDAEPAAKPVNIASKNLVAAASIALKNPPSNL